MPTVHFIGRIVPSGLSVTMSGIPQVKYDSPEFDLHTLITLHVNNSVVDLECALDRFSQGDLVHLHKISFDLARALISLYDFSTGIGLTVVFESFIGPNGVSSIFLPSDRSLAPLCTAFVVAPNQASKSFVEMVGVVFREPPLFMALNELIESITFPHSSTVNGARAIERLRNLTAPAGKSRKDTWAYLRQNLQIERDYLEFVTAHSTGPRHGDPAFIPGDIATEVTRRAWTIMNRFLEFRKRGNQPLHVSEFPLLTS